MLSHEDLAAEMIVLGLFLRITRLRWKFVFIAFIGFHEQPLELLKKNKQTRAKATKITAMDGRSHLLCHNNNLFCGLTAALRVEIESCESIFTCKHNMRKVVVLPCLR